MGNKELEELEEALRLGETIGKVLEECINQGMGFSDLSKRREETESSLEQALFVSPTQLRYPDIKASIESSCRSLFHRLTEEERIEEGSKAYLLYECSFWLIKREIATGILAILLVSDLLEKVTIHVCEHIFDLFIEKQRTKIVNIAFPAAKNTFLKMCTELLRKIPKSNYPLLSSKVYIFLCDVFPLTDRSGVNLRSEHNVSTFLFNDEHDNEETTSVILPSNTNKPNTLDSDEEEEAGEEEEEEAGKKEEKKKRMVKEFGKSVTRLQEFFVNPNILYATNGSSDNWNCFVRLIESILVTFTSTPIHSTPSHLTLPSSKSSPALSSTDPDELQLYFLKYTTSPRLLSLLIGDVAYRRQLLTQFLIFFQSLLVKITPVSTKPLYSLSDKQKRRIGEMKKRITTLLDKLKDGNNSKKRFSDSLFNIHLPREKNWVYWKRDGCKPFEKIAQLEEQTTLKQPKRQLEQVTGVAGKRIKKNTLDFAVITKAVKNAADQQIRIDEKAKKNMIPDLLDYLQPLAEQMDPAAGIEDEYKLSKNKVYEWKALRLIARTKLQYFSKMTHGNNLEHVVKIIQDEQKAKEEQQKKSKDETNQDKTDQVVKMNTEDSQGNEECTPSLENDKISFDSNDNEEEVEEVEGIVIETTEEVNDETTLFDADEPPSVDQMSEIDGLEDKEEQEDLVGEAENEEKNEEKEGQATFEDGALG